MDEIYEMLPSGIFNDINGFNDYVSENGIESIYEMLPEGIFNSQEGFNNYVQKKKDESDSISPKEVMGGNIQVMGEDGSLEPSVQEDEAEAATPVEEVVAETPAVVEEVVAEEINPATAQFNFDDYTEESVEPTVTEGVMYDPKEEGMQFDTTITYPESSTTFERSLSYITPQLIRREEEEVVNRMDYLFGDDVDGGFEFEETDAGDAMIVTASNGETHYVNLDKFGQILNEDGEYINSLLESERPNIIKFQEFLRNNRKPFEGDEVSYKEDLENIKYFSRKAVDLDVATVKSESNALTQRFLDYKKTLSNVQFQIDDLSQQSSLNPEQLALYNSLLSQKKELSNEKNSITDKYENLIKSNAQIERNVGEYLSMKLDDGNAVSTLAKGFMNGLVTKGITSPIASLVGGVMDVFYGVAQSIDEDFGMTEDEKKERYVTIAKDLGYDIPDNIEDDTVYNSWIEGLNNPEMEEGSGYSREINDLLIADGYDPTRTLVATGSGGGRMMWKKDGGLLGNGEYEQQPDYAFDKTKGERLKRLVLDAEVKESKNPTKEYVRHMLDFMAAEGVSDERVARNKGESIIQEGLYGLAESLPSIALYALARGKNKPAAEPVKGVLKRLGRSFKNYITNRGAVAQTLGFTLLQTDALMVEMENDPDFKYITETEKKALTLPLAITTAVLERWGLRSIVTNKTLVANLMKTVTSRLAVGASPSAFRTMMNKVVQHNISKGVYRVAGATVMEYETGGLQQVAEIGMKDVWNDMYEKEMFTTPDGKYLEWGSEYLQQVNRAALAEAVGGFVMGTPGAIATAFNKNQFDDISDDMVDLFDEIRNDKVTVEAYKARLDLKVITKEMTKEEAQKALLDFEVLSSSAETVSGIQGLTKQQTKEALGLTYLKNQLEHLLSKTDPNVGNNYELIEAQLNDVTSKLKNIGTSRVITQEEEELVEDIKSEQDILDTQDLTQEDRTAREENLTKLKQELSAVQEAATEKAPVTQEEKDLIEDLNDDEVYTFTVETLEDVPESQRATAEKVEGAEIITRKKILGVPVGPKTTIKSGAGYRYRITGKEAKINANAIQESSTEEVDVQEPSTNSREVGEGDTTVQPSITGETQEEGESESDIAQTAEEEVSLDERAEQIDELIKKENEDSAPKEPQPIPEEQIEVVDETISINKPKAPPVRNNPLRESVIRRAKNVSKSLKKVFPNVKIILHETSEAFVDATGRLGRGEYIGNTIHVNLELADGTTVGHEAFHVIIVNKLLTDTAAQEVTKRMLKSLLKTLRNNDPLAIEIRNFMKGYDQKIQTEEGVSQMLGILSSRYKLLAPKQKTIIGKWIDIIKKLLGKEVDIITESDQQVVDLLNTLISKLTSGIEIESSDLSVIDKIKEDVDNTPAVEAETEVEVEAEAEADKPTQRQQKTVEGLREGKMTTTTPVKIYKGIGGKMDIFGQRINAHKGVKGIFSAVDKKLAEEYGRKEGVAEIDLPSGVTIEVVEVATKGLDPKQYRAAEVKAINESDAQVVKLITIEGKVKGLLRNGDGKQQQYIIKDFDLVPELKAQKPTTRQQQVNVFEGGEQQQGEGGEVGVIRLQQPIQQDFINAPKVDKDSRPWVKRVTNTIDVITLNGKNFITNMYDYTNAGRTDLGNGYEITLFGGRNYVPYIMDILGKKLGDVSHLAAFNTKAQAETFIRNSIEGDANYFAPHAGTLDGSWQFQQHIFEALTDMVLDKNIISNEELIKSFNRGLVRTPKALALALKEYKKNDKSFTKKGYYTQNKKKIYKAPVKPTKRIDAFKKFLKKYNEEQSKEDSKLTKLKNTENLNDFLNNPKKLVRLLNIENNFSPDLRKRLNQNIATNAKFKKAIGISRIDQFHQRIIDPLNKGVEGGEIMSFVKFDPSTFEIVKTDPNSPEHHPSFGWVVKAKIEQVSQPTKFYKSYEITDQYVKHNKNETIVSKKEDVTDAEFKSSNVSSSAGAIPKVAQVSIKESTTQRQQRTERLAPNGKRSNLTDVQYDTVRTKAFKNWFGNWETDPANASKVVDENGEPLVVYHGTPDGRFLDEDGIFKSQDQIFGMGSRIGVHWFVKDITTAKSYAKDKFAFDYQNSVPKVLPAFLNIKNPFIKNGENSLWRNVQQKGKTRNLISKALESKKDGVIVDNVKDNYNNSNKTKSTDTFTVFNSNQIKLADGSNKTFDPDAPSIRQQIVDDTKSADNETKLRRFQDIVDKFSSATDIVNMSRMAGFEDTEIRYYLQKKWRGEIDSKGNYKKLTVKEINKLLKAEELETVPASFGNVPGGMIKGLKLYQDTLAHFKKLIAQNEKKSKNKQISIQDIIHKSIEFMSTQTSYIDSSEGSKAKKQLSTLQQQLQSEMYEALGGKKIKEITKIISNLNKIIYQKRIGAREIRDVKRELQRVIREVMPKGVYTSSEVRSLLRQIQEAEPKWLKGNLKNIIQNIEEMAAEKNVSTLTKSIDEILNGKYVVTINNQSVGVKISQEYAEVLEAIKDKMYKGAEISDDIISEQAYIMTKIEELDNKMSLSPKEEMEYLVLNIALGINNAKLMDNNNPLKADQLLSVFENLKSLVTQGRNNFKADAKARSERYAKLTAKFYQALTNGEDVLDFTDEAVREKVEKAVKDARTLKDSNYGKEGTINKLKSYFQTIADNMVMVLSASTLDMSQLNQQLDMLPGEMFEGYIRDFMYRKVNESSRSYQESYMALQDLMTDKSIEYLGKKYTSKIKEYRKSLDFSEIENGKFFKDPKAVKEAQDEYNKNKTIKNRNTLNKVIALNIPFGDLTPMKLQYIYFQYKQPDTHAGFETSLGSNYKVIMDGLSKHFENNYKDLLNFGNWQVDVLLPLLHSKYNKVYKKIYHTNMPQRLNYSGRTFRLITAGGKVEMQKQGPLSLLGGEGTSQMSLNVIGNSTKLTKPNKEAIMAVDALTAIDSYLKDMEHFNAYAVNMNDISKVFFNKDIADTIINIHGKLVYNAIKNSLMASAMRGSNQSDEIIRMTNSANSVFIVNKVGAALTVYIKQLTSIATYGNFIGYRNWTKTAATMGRKEFMKAIKEISEESVYMKWRSFEQITKTIENYGDTSMDKYTPGDKGGIIMRIITSPIKAGDKQAIYLGGIPNYVFLKKKYEAAGLSPEAAKQKALLMFEEHTKVVQQSSDKQDKDWLQNMGGAVQFFNMLLSSPKAYFRQIFSGYRELGRKVKAKDLNAGKGSAWQNIRTILVYQFGMPLLFQWATIGFPITDWDDEDKSDMKRAGLLSVFNSIFVVGQILEMIADKAQGKPWWKETKQLPIFDLVTDFIKQWDKTNNKDPEKAAEATKQAYFALLPLLALLKVPTSIASLPLKRLDNWQKNMDKIINGSATDPKEIMLRILNYSQSIAEQGKEEKPSKPLKLTKKELKEHLPELYEELEDVRMEMESDPDYIDYMNEKKLYDDAVKQEREQALEEIFAK